MKKIEVVAAIIHDEKERIFATQRGYGDFKDGWEFPGGKMEPGESPEEALKREITLDDALFLVSCRKWFSDVKGTRGSSVAQQGTIRKYRLATCG